METAKGYWIGRLDVTDTQAYAQYRALNAKAFAKFGGRFIVRGAAGFMAMGAQRAHNVVIEFADYDTALACYHSEEYQAAVRFLAQVGEVDLVIVPGYPG